MQEFLRAEKLLSEKLISDKVPGKGDYLFKHLVKDFKLVDIDYKVN
jgi:hypothetical protein